MRLPFADDKFLLITQSQHPAMAGNRSHLPDVIGVHDGVAMHALKARSIQTGFGGAKCLRRQETPLGGHDPDQFALGLQSQDFIQIEQK